MIDKVQKIREEVERMHNLLPVMDGDNISVNYADKICTTLEMYIDSLQKEPVSNPTPNKKMSVERWKKACEAACCDINYRSHYGLTETRDDYFVDGVQWADEHPKDIQAEKDLELTWEDIKTIDKLLNQCVDYSNPYQEVLKRFKDYKERKEK